MRLGALSRLAALVAAGLMSLTACDFSVSSLPLPGGADVGDDPITVKVVFRDVLDLVPKSSVKVNDVTVGEVTDIALDGQYALVTLRVRNDVELPSNALAELRQTSLLGEKFVSLSEPETGASTTPLEDGAVIPLERSGRNPEIEEVLGALSLVLNGGGVAQLKTIADELNQALEGREGTARDVLVQIRTFMEQVDTNKAQVVAALSKLDNLAKSLDEQKGTLALALDELPSALDAINQQRADLVKMLKALAELSNIGTHVIKASKASTITSINALNPVLNKLAQAGSNFPRSLQVSLTYPFVDAVVGQNAQQARDLHMGDYTNLSVQLDVDLSGSGGITVPGLPGGPDLNQLCKESPLSPLCTTPLPSVPAQSLPIPTISLAVPTLLSDPLGGLGGVGSIFGFNSAQPSDTATCTGAPCRPAPADTDAASTEPVALPTVPSGELDPTLAALLVWGMVER